MKFSILVIFMGFAAISFINMPVMVMTKNSTDDQAFNMLNSDGNITVVTSSDNSTVAANTTSGEVMKPDSCGCSLVGPLGWFFLAAIVAQIVGLFTLYGYSCFKHRQGRY